jgi:6-phosphogluconolactonase
VSTPEVFVYASGDLLASAVAARAVTRLADAIAARGRAHLVLTGGGIGTKVMAAIAACPARDAVDWGLVDIWWGDERFEPTGDPERNETGARSALLDHIGTARIHVIAGPDGADDPDTSAARYAAELKAAAGEGAVPSPGGTTPPGTPPAEGAAVPAFDVLLLGIGAEGHVASIFPDSPAAHADGTVVAVRNSPKPPPTRVSLTFGAIQAAREVWILASGAEKAEAVAEALSGVSQDKLPAAGARGTDRTLFLLDTPASRSARLLPAYHRRRIAAMIDTSAHTTMNRKMTPGATVPCATRSTQIATGIRKPTGLRRRSGWSGSASASGGKAGRPPGGTLRSGTSVPSTGCDGRSTVS